jgi:hypothetical protein
MLHIKPLRSSSTEEVGEIKPKIVDEIKDEIRAKLQEDVSREIEDQKIRAFNLIVFNLPESEDVSSSIGLFLFGVGLPSRNNNLISGS